MQTPISPSNNHTEDRVVPCRGCGVPVVVRTVAQAMSVLCQECQSCPSFLPSPLPGGSFATRPQMMVAVDRKGSYKINMAAGDEQIEVEFNGYIGGWDGINAIQFKRDLKAAIKSATKSITILMNSGGGDVFEATAIYSYLLSLSQEVHIKVIGVAASAATLIAMVADKVTMAANAYWMVHGVRGGIYGTSEEIRDYLKLLDDANENARKTYQARTGMDEEEIRALLAKDSWLSPEEALEMKFIDGIDPIVKVKPHVKPKEAMRFRFDAHNLDKLFAQAVVAQLAASVEPDDDEDEDDDLGESNLDSKQSTKDSAAVSKGMLPAANHGNKGDSSMNPFQKWLKALGFEEANLSADQLAKLKTKYEAEVKAEEDAKLKSGGIAPESKADDGQVPNVAATVAAQLRRNAAIQAKCGSEYMNIAADAIEQNWDDARLDAELRAAKAEAQIKRDKDASPEGEDFGAAFNVHVKTGKPQETRDLLSVALSLSAGVSVDDLLKPYDGMTRQQQLKLGINQAIKPVTEQQIELAQTYYPGFGLQELILRCNQLHKSDLSMTWRGDASIEASHNAFNAPVAQFSTVTVPQVLKDTVDRAVIAGYKKAEPKWNQFAGVETVRDFKAVEKFRVFGTGRWEKVGETGEIKHGQLGAESAYKLQVEAEGQIMMITREMIQNNDVGQISEIGESMAMYGRLGPEFALFDLINATYATANNTFAFTYADLEKLWKAWIQKTMYDPKDVKKDAGRAMQAALDLEPAVVLVNKTRELDMKRILSSTLAVTGGGATAQLVPTMNALEGSLNVVSSSYFWRKANANKDVIAMMPGPNLVPAFKVAFLNGRQVPWIQQVMPAPNYLGFGVRGWIDFGVAATESFLVATDEDIPA